jgi:hypothetical protein
MRVPIPNSEEYLLLRELTQVVTFRPIEGLEFHAQHRFELCYRRNSLAKS